MCTETSAEKNIVFTNEELERLMECVLVTLDQFDEAKKALCNTIALDSLEESRSVYQKLILKLEKMINE